MSKTLIQEYRTKLNKTKQKQKGQKHSQSLAV